MAMDDPKIPVIHYNKRLHVLLVILLFVVVAGLVTLYQIRKAEISTSPNSQMIQELSPQESQKIQAELKTTTAETPPLSQAQISKIIGDLRKMTK